MATREEILQTTRTMKAVHDSTCSVARAPRSSGRSGRALLVHDLSEGPRRFSELRRLVPGDQPANALRAPPGTWSWARSSSGGGYDRIAAAGRVRADAEGRALLPIIAEMRRSDPWLAQADTSGFEPARPRIAILLEPMPTYRELLQQVKARDRRDRRRPAHAAARRRRQPLVLDVRERDEWDEGHIPGAVHIPRGYLESRIEQAAPDRDRRDRRLLRRRHPLGVRRRRRSRSSATSDVVDARRRLHRLEAERLPDVAPALARPRPAHALQPPPPDPRGRRGGPAEAARLARAADRRRRARLAGVALPRRRRRRHARHRRRRHRRRDEPPAPDRPLDRARSASRRSSPRKRTLEALNPDVKVRRLPRAADLRERRPDPRRRLGRDRRRRRQLPDPLPRERRVRLARHPRRPRLDLPLRGPGDRLQARRRPVLPLPLPAAAAAGAGPELRRGRRARRAPRRSSARSRRTRRSSSRSGSASRSSAGCCSSTRSRRASPRSRCAATRTARSAASTPTITEYIDYVEFCQGGGTSTAMSDRSHPADAPRARPAASREVEAERRDGRASCSTTSPIAFPRSGARSSTDDDIAPFVNVYVDGEDVRTLDGLETPVRRGRDGDPAARRWRAAVPSATRSVRRCSTLVGGTPLVELPRARAPRAEASGSTRSSRGRTRPDRSRTASRRR